MCIARLRRCCGGFGRRGHLGDHRNEMRFVASVGCVRSYLNDLVGRGRLSLHSRVGVLSINTKANECSIPLTRRNCSIATFRLIGRGLNELGRGDSGMGTCRNGTAGLGGFKGSRFSLALMFKPVCRLGSTRRGLTTLGRTGEIAGPNNCVLITCVVGRCDIVACTVGRGRVGRNVRNKVLSRDFRYARGTGSLCDFIQLRSVRTLGTRTTLAHRGVVTTSKTTGCVEPFLGSLSRRRFSVFMRCRLSAYRETSLVKTDTRAISVLEM